MGLNDISAKRLLCVYKMSRRMTYCSHMAMIYQDAALPASGQGRFKDDLELQRKALEIIKKNDDNFT